MGDRAPGWTADGRIAFTRCLGTGAAQRLVVEPDSGRLEPLARGTEVIRSARSPDGLLIAFARRSTLLVRPPDGRFTRRVFQQRFAGEAPAWSPDGRWVAFSHPGVRSTIYVVRRDGLALRPVTNG